MQLPQLSVSGRRPAAHRCLGLAVVGDALNSNTAALRFDSAAPRPQGPAASAVEVVDLSA